MLNYQAMRETAKQLRADGMRCNCDLDNWEPEPSTGHSWVCRIHKAVRAQYEKSGYTYYDDKPGYRRTDQSPPNEGGRSDG
jgi:hypothetical protein